MNRLSKSKSDGKVSMFVGMDLHKNYLQIAVMNKEGIQKDREVLNLVSEWPLLHKLLSYWSGLVDQATFS